ncbi:MAG TPA: hypothetical protein VEL76_26525, partial [Gemmataceae bacterium]|nr:hypothetical protein [Gemmataceae bacterium]
SWQQGLHASRPGTHLPPPPQLQPLNSLPAGLGKFPQLAHPAWITSVGSACAVGEGGSGVLGGLGKFAGVARGEDRSSKVSRAGACAGASGAVNSSTRQTAPKGCRAWCPEDRKQVMPMLL